MIDSTVVKQYFKDSTDDEAKALFGWITAAMEVRGLIDIAGAPAPRKRRADAGMQRKPGQHAEGCICVKCDPACQPTVEAVRERIGEQHTLLGDKHQ